MENLLRWIKAKWFSLYLIYAYCILTYLLFVYIKSFSHSGGEQIIMYGIADVFYVFPTGMAVIALLSILLHKNKKKKYLLVNIIVLVGTLSILFGRLLKEKPEYYESYKMDYDKRGKVEIIKRYYYKDNMIHSVMFYINDLKDSTWLYYDKEGKVKQLQKYKKNILVMDSIISPQPQ